MVLDHTVAGFKQAKMRADARFSQKLFLLFNPEQQHRTFSNPRDFAWY
jgi:hypothetical protein